MTAVKKVDFEILKELPKKSDKAKALMETFLGRERYRAITTYQTAKKALKEKNISLNQSDFENITKDLERANVGTLGSRGRAKFFKWDWNLITVAEVALSDSKTLEPVVSRAQRMPKLVHTAIKPQEKQREDKVVMVEPKKVVPMSDYKKPKPDLVTVRYNGFEVDMTLEEVTPQNCKKVQTLLINLTANM